MIYSHSVGMKGSGNLSPGAKLVGKDGLAPRLVESAKASHHRILHVGMIISLKNLLEFNIKMFR